MLSAKVYCQFFYEFPNISLSVYGADQKKKVHKMRCVKFCECGNTCKCWLYPLCTLVSICFSLGAHLIVISKDCFEILGPRIKPRLGHSKDLKNAT